MGLKSALGRLKKIAEHVDAPTTKIDDWVWRPLSDVHRDTGYIEEVPAYIQDGFGQFMLDQTERARRGEMGPRDLLKAYGITRSSVMRTARKLHDIESAGLKIYDPESEMIRPEGAFSSWLMSPAGQKYLELAEQGVADTDSIEDIRRKFRVFGMQNMLADDLRYAAENLAPKGRELNEMLFAPIDDWRGFTEGIKGVSSGKSGFPASMLGRGDIGTFDAREIKGHTGMSSEDAGRYMSRSRQGRPIGGYEAVDRMGDRQRAMDVRIDPALEPYYQHLVHHGNWDAFEGDQTTHNDLIRTLRPGMAKGGLVALAEKVFKAAQEAPRETVTAYKLFRTNPRHPEHLFPLFVDADRPVPMGEWLRAEAGPAGKTEGRVKSKLGDLAYRPGWHAGDLPIATHIGGGGSPPTYRPDNQVWAEIEMPADVDWQSIADSRARMTKAGLPDLKTAHITDQVPYGGYYRYKTNPNMTGNWLIGGDMRVNRVLTDDEVRAINDAHGVADLPRFKAEDIGEPEEYARGGLVEDEVEPGLWALMKRYGSALGDMADEEWEAAKARGAKQNAIDYAKGMAANVPMLAGMPVDALDLFRAAMPPRESANPYANSLRGMLDKYIGTEEEPLYGSEYLMDRVKDAGLDLEGEGLGYQTGNLLGLAGVGGLLKRGVRGATRRLREP
jgi:hypothetical protein